MTKLILKDIYKHYDSVPEDEFAVKGISLECNDGEFVGFLGPSGCGKTTTLRMIAGLEDVTKGDIILGERHLNDLHPKNRDIGLAFEDYALYPPLSVYENIVFNLRARKTPESQIKQKIDRIAKLLHVDDLLHMQPSSLSGGQKQRVNIARALIREPKLLLLDEPLSHLDGKMRQSMRKEIKHIQMNIGCTSIIVTHDQLEAMSLADRIAVIKDGVLQQFDTPMNIFHNPANEFIASFIGDPPMNIMDATIQKTLDGFNFSIQAETEVCIPVPEHFYSVIHDGMKIRLGARPTEVLIDDDPDSKSSAIPMATYEDLGDERHLHFHLKEQYLTLITHHSRVFNPGEKVKLKFIPKSTLIFEATTGKRIYGKEK